MSTQPPPPQTALQVREGNEENEEAGGLFDKLLKKQRGVPLEARLLDLSPHYLI